jgi:hypothetical protein
VSSAFQTEGRTMTTTRRALITLGLAVVLLLTLSGAARAATAKAPAWKVLAATGPTNLPPFQSEVQGVVVGAESGTFTLSHSLSEGTGTLTRTFGLFLTTTSGSDEGTFFFPEEALAFKAGEVVVESEGLLPPGTVIESVDTATGTLKFSAAALATGEVFFFEAASTEVTDVTGQFRVGQEIVGAGIAPATTITSVGPTSLTISKPPTAGGENVAIASSEATTPAIPYNASAAQVQAALEAMPGYEAGTFAVTGGPGGAADTPYSIVFGGALADRDVPNFVAGTSGFGPHDYVHVRALVPGGHGTGEVVVLPNDVGGEGTSGEINLEIGPLPAGVVVSGPVHQEFGESVLWNCTTSESSVSCSTTDASPALTPTPYVRFPVEVTSAVPLSALAPVTISGGGAARGATFQLPIVVSNEAAKPGFAALYSGAFEADGTPSTQAGGHPYSQVTAFQLNSRRTPSGAVVPSASLKDLNVDLPSGFIGNPLTTARCPAGVPVPVGIGVEEAAPACNGTDQTVGRLWPEAERFGDFSVGVQSGITNDVPVRGLAAEFFSKIGIPIVGLTGSVRSEEDFGVRVGAPNAPVESTVFYSDTVFYGEPVGGHGKAFFRNPTDCSEEARETPSVRLSASSYEQPNVFATAGESQAPITGCDQLHFAPQFGFQPGTTQGSSGTGASAHLHIDQAGLTDTNQLGAPDLKRSVVTLPAGLDLNPAQAGGLQACSEAQVGYRGPGALPNPTRFNNDPVTCPDASKLGIVEAVSPILEEPLKGTIYLAAQEENPFNSLIGIYLVFESERFGITLKLPGKVDTDPQTGQVTATFDYVPQQPLEDLTLNFRGGGPRSEFATPEVCGTYTTKASWEPWSAPQSGPPSQTEDSFAVSGGCSSSASTRPFAPSFEAGTTGTQAGAYTPLVIKVGRKDGEQELTSLNFSLPKGLIGKLAGIPYCSDAAIAAAEGKTGRAEAADPSCPAASQIGSVDTAAGVGSEPFHVGGRLYLAGPYKGAPVSAVVISPALAGPFDLGDVVVRSPLYIDRETTALTAKSDPLPTILKGIPLKLRAVTINVDKPGFIVNPTSCTPASVTASIGSGNGATASPTNRFQVGGCENLKFAPKLNISLKGGTGRNGHPSLTAVLTQDAGQANIGYTSVALPHSEFLEQAHIRTVCTRIQFAADQCPSAAVYGQAEAISPLLAQPLTGPVYLRSSSNKLPDLVAALKGPASQPIEVDLDGRIDSFKGGIRATFETVPDAPVSKFVLKMEGGKKGLLVNSTNICKGVHKSTVKMKGQNGKLYEFQTPTKAQCGKTPKKHEKKKK